MMKHAYSLKYSEGRETGEAADRAVRTLLQRIPRLQFDDPNLTELDVMFQILLGKKERYMLGCEVKSSGQPKIVERALLSLKNWAAEEKYRIPMIVAPYLTPKVRQQIADGGCGYLDFAGNARLAFGDVYIELETAAIPKAAARELRSLFSPRSALVLRALLSHDTRPWKLVELSKETTVSLGQVSNVVKALEERNLVRRAEGGIVLVAGNDLIDEWRSRYRASQGEELTFYTPLHGNQLRDALALSTGVAWPSQGNAVLASFSAANLLAPYTRNQNTFIYADMACVHDLQERLQLREVAEGGNVLITVPIDDGVFYQAEKQGRGPYHTSPIQTYLDLSVAGDRGQEAAQFLRDRIPLWNAEP